MDTDEVEDEDLLFFLVEEIVNSRRVRGQVQYRVHWKEHSEDSDIWKPIENLWDPDVMKLILSFYSEFPQKPVHASLDDRL